MLNKEPDSESLTRITILDGESKTDGTRTVAGPQSVSNSDSLSRMEFTARRNRQRPSAELLPKDFFVTEKWHRPYAYALMEKDPAKLTPLVAEAEHAIFNRYLELSVSPAPPEYFRDLQNAIDILIKMKTSTGFMGSVSPE